MAEIILSSRNNKTVKREGDTVLKVFNGGYSKADVMSEALNQALLEETELNIPPILGVQKLDGLWTIRSAFIEGTTIRRSLREHPERSDELIRTFVSLHRSVHALVSPRLEMQRDALHRLIRTSSLDATTRYELHTRLDASPVETKVCHGDFSPSNVILNADGRYFIVDWPRVTQGSPAADAAWTYLLFKLSGDEASAEKYIALYAESSGIAETVIRGWIPIVAAARSAKCGAEERERLLGWVNEALN